MNIQELNDAVAAVCPIDGVNSDGAIFFQASATAPQKAAAQLVMTTNLPLLNGVSKNATVLAQIDTVKAQFTDTLQMAAIAGTPSAVATVQGLNTQLTTLKSQLVP